MNNSQSGVWHFISEYSYQIILALFVLWMCIGIFPLQCYETDGQEIILGCDVMYRDGWTLPPVYSYEYRMQPLIMIVVVCLKHLMPFFTCEEIYCVLTVIAGLAFLLGSLSLARHITGAGKTITLIAAMLLPEMYAILMYANTAIFAAACFVWALMLIIKGKWWQAVLLLCIGAWFRVDIVSVYPVVLPLLYYEGKTLWQSFWKAAVCGLSVAVISLFGYWLMNADALGTYGNYERWNDMVTPALRFYAIFGFYSLAYFILLPLGLCVILGQKRWKELFVVLLPIVLLHGVMSSFGNASKHFLYIAPFVIIAGIRALQWLCAVCSKRPILKWTGIIVAILFMAVSVRQKRLELAWLQNNPLNNVGIVAPIADFHVAGKDIAVAIGAGPQVITRDEYMLATGHLFYSWYIHSIKTVLQEWRKQQKAVIDKASSSNILTYEWGASAPISYEYVTEGYHYCQKENMPDKYAFTIKNEKRELNFWRVLWTEEEHDVPSVVARMDSLSSAFLPGDKYIIAAPAHFGSFQFLDELSETGKLEKQAERIYKIK